MLLFYKSILQAVSYFFVLQNVHQQKKKSLYEEINLMNLWRMHLKLIAIKKLLFPLSKEASCVIRILKH